MVKVTQSLLLRSSPPLLGKGRGGGHGQTEPSSLEALLFFCEREGVVSPSDARVVVGPLAIVVHLHDVGLGLLVGLCPTDPSLATLAVDRQALLLTSFPLLGKGRGGRHSHTEPSS